MMNHKELLFSQISTDPSYKLEDYFLDNHVRIDADSSHRIIAFNELNFKTKEPRLTNWDFLDHKDVEKLFTLENEKQIREFIGSSLKKCPKGKPKDIFIQLILSVRKLCRNHSFDLEQSGAVLSFFYLTHLYFTSNYDTSAEKVYIYFKDLMMCHSIPFPPSSKKLFTLKEAREITEFFGKIYLRNLPLIRYLCLPNFALFLSYELPPDPVLPTKKAKGGKKEKKSKAGKKGKKK